MTTANPLVSVRDVEKSYAVGGQKILDRISFDVAADEVLVICGPSGCGKSTMLRCINGLEPIAAGSIEVLGLRVDRASTDELKRLRMNCGLVFQNFNLFPHMKVLENVTAAPILVRGTPADQAREEAQALLKSVGLADKGGQWPYQLSGGQRQRVAIARALAMRPSLMMFDEPTSSLDPEMREEVMNVIRQVHEEFGMAMIVVTHEIGFAKTVADRAMLMDAGRIVEHGPARDFFTKPQTERAQRFLRAIIND